MLKNKFKIITILIILILSITLPTVRAVETDSDVTVEEENQSTDSVSEETNLDSDSFKRNDVYITDDEVVIDYIIDGNLFVIANNVTINSQIGGDAFICAKNITVNEKGYIFSNLFAVSNNITINGVVYDLYSTANNTTINGYIYRDIRSISDTMNIFGTIGRNAYLNFKNINLTNTENETETKGVITGNLKYSSNKEVSIPDDIVGGEINFNKISTTNSKSFWDYLISLGKFIATIIIVCLICLWLSPKLIKDNSSLITTKKVLPIIGFGILTPIVIIIISIILFILGITSTIGILLLGILFILMTISTPIFVINLNNIVCDKLNITKFPRMLGILVMISIVIWLIFLIPYVGSILRIITLILGLGIIIYKSPIKEILKRNTDSKKEDLNK